MKGQAQVCQLLAIAAFVILPACQREKSLAVAGMLPTSRLSTVMVSPALPLEARSWPQFFLIESHNRFLWGGAQKVFRVEYTETGEVHAEPAPSELTKGLDRLIAAARSPEGTLAFLDSSGNIAVRALETGKSFRFKTRLEGSAAGLAVARELVYVLLQGDLEGSNAVVAYDFSGAEAGRWGTMPVDAVIQKNLKGCGIAACPDGSVFYSYINSAQLHRLPSDSTGVPAMESPSASFSTLKERDVRKAIRESEESRSVAPLVKLGLGTSRIMALHW